MKNTLDMTANRFLVRAKANPMLILTVSGEFVPESLCVPGRYCAKLYKDYHVEVRRNRRPCRYRGCS